MQVGLENNKGKLEVILDKYTPLFIKKFCLALVEKLPEKPRKWIKQNKMKTIYAYFIIRGLFLRPSMWAVYAIIFSWASQQL